MDLFNLNVFKSDTKYTLSNLPSIRVGVKLERIIKRFMHFEYLGAVITGVGYIVAHALYRYNHLGTAILVLVLVGIGVILSFMRRRLGSIESSMPPPKKKKTKPNEKCPCGSGKKHKKCCMVALDLYASQNVSIEKTLFPHSTGRPGRRKLPKEKKESS